MREKSKETGLADHLYQSSVDPDIADDCCWQDADGSWWRVDLVRGVAYTYCMAEHGEAPIYDNLLRKW